MLCCIIKSDRKGGRIHASMKSVVTARGVCGLSSAHVSGDFRSIYIKIRRALYEHAYVRYILYKKRAKQ